ncbi:hypothetical protein [Paraburkholderia sp. GAS334]|uniref:hypothetical protein n=1 Tax=Paraburkholderia sp. GAS334 TaxID=3035131 RepID=UPI003D2570A3
MTDEDQSDIGKFSPVGHTLADTTRPLSRPEVKAAYDAYRMADLAALRKVPVHVHNGRRYYVRLSEIPAPWQDAFRAALRGSCCPAIDGEGECAFEWDWSDWLHGRLPHG